MWAWSSRRQPLKDEKRFSPARPVVPSERLGQQRAWQAQGLKKELPVIMTACGIA
jgi:hypothetical protein